MTMEKNILNKEQIEAWRKVIFMQLEQKFAGAGAYALIMPESDIIEYWRKMKAILEQPQKIYGQEFKRNDNVEKISIKKTCNHSNSITGNNGKYCIDCEKYV